MKITQKEIESVSKLDTFSRYKYAIKRIADSECLYSLRNPDNTWAIAEVEDNKLFSIWSAKEFALINAIDLWLEYIPIEISLNSFEEEIVPLIKDNGYLINVFSLNNKSGFIVDIDEFIRDLSEELQNYE